MERSFIDLFEEQVLKTPDNIAVVFEENSCTYQHLNERSNRLAHWLRSKGIKEEDLVPLYHERGINMIVGMLGIKKPGSAKVPDDTENPNEPSHYFLKDTAAGIVV